jgi:hypothetical protein
MVQNKNFPRKIDSKTTINQLNNTIKQKKNINLPNDIIETKINYFNFIYIIKIIIILLFFSYIFYEIILSYIQLNELIDNITKKYEIIKQFTINNINNMKEYIYKEEKEEIKEIKKLEKKEEKNILLQLI